jgi:hypothetical protein
MIIVQGLKGVFLLTAGYGGSALMTALNLGRNVGTGDGAQVKGSSDTTANGGVG